MLPAVSTPQGDHVPVVVPTLVMHVTLLPSPEWDTAMHVTRVTHATHATHAVAATTEGAGMA